MWTPSSSLPTGLGPGLGPGLRQSLSAGSCPDSEHGAVLILTMLLNSAKKQLQSQQSEQLTADGTVTSRMTPSQLQLRTFKSSTESLSFSSVFFISMSWASSTSWNDGRGATWSSSTNTAPPLPHPQLAVCQQTAAGGGGAISFRREQLNKG